MSDWPLIPKPAELAEQRLIEAILDGSFPTNSTLPPERELAIMLGVTRPTLREALQRLSRDGWLEIHHGKPTRVTDYFREGSLGILNTLAHHPHNLPASFVPDLLRFRIALAPTYAREAVQNHPQKVSNLLETMQFLDDEAETFAKADVRLHAALTSLSDNCIFPLVYNGFVQLSRFMGITYFSDSRARGRSRTFYADLWETAKIPDADKAELITREVMTDSLNYWLKIASTRGSDV